MKRASFACVWALLCLSASTVSAQSALTVVSTEPQGDLTSRQHANEIRIVFSEPMATLGKIPDQVQAPFVRITPPVNGSFRWSGTTILIFTPEPPLPFSSRYEVSVDGTATAVSGRKLEKPVNFTFTTPTVRLNRVRWFRRGGTVNGRIVLMLYFNQPLRSADVAAALSARFEPHDWRPPQLQPDQAAALRAADPTRRHEWTAAEREPLPCSWHHLAEDGPITIWPPEYRAWAAEHMRPAALDARGADLRRADVRHADRPGAARRTAGAPRATLEIVSPADGSTYLIDPTLRAEFQALSLRAVAARRGPVEWTVNGVEIGTADADAKIDWPLVPGKHRIIARDARGQTAAASVVVR